MKFIAIRQEKDGSLYMSKYFFDRFSEKDLGSYRYQKIELTDEEFANVQVDDFVVDETSGLIYFSTELQEKRLAREKELAELPELYQWFTYYDNQIAQYNRCLRLNVEFDKDITELDAEASRKQLRIREITGKEPRVYQCGNDIKTEINKEE